MEPIRQAQERRLLQSERLEQPHIPTVNNSRGEDYTELRLPQHPRPSHQYLRPTDHDSIQMPPPKEVPNDAHRTQPRQRTSFSPASTPRRPMADESRFSSVPPGGESSSITNDFRSATPALQTQRFVPSVPSTPSGRQRLPASSSATGSSGFFSGLLNGGRGSGFRPASNAVGSGQRLPFVPSNQGT